MKILNILSKIVFITNEVFIKTSFGRIRIFFVAFFVAFFVINIWLLMAFYKNKDSDKNLKQIKANRSFIQQRADIIDRNGIPLAKNIFAYNLYVQPSKMVNIQEDINKLCEIFPNLAQNKDKIINDIQARADKEDLKNSWFLIKQQILQIDRDRIIESGIVGVQFEPSQSRIYPHNNMASHILGFLSIDGDGMSGIERRFNSDLITKTEPIELSIDVDLQGIVRGVLSKAMKKYNSKFAFGIIMNIHTGEIISAVSLPDFNPNNIGKYDDNRRFNRFSQGVYELGSVFKIFPASAAIESGVTLSKKYDTSKNIEIGDFTIHDLGKKNNYEYMTLPDILRVSSNIGCVKMVLEDVGTDNLRELYERLGFFRKLNIELLESGRPILPNKWGKVQTITTSYGHGIAVTPLHFISGASAVLNGGVTVNPTFLKVKKESDIKKGEAVVSPRASKTVAKLLRKVVTSGSGRRAITEKYDIGGKSGTATQPVKGKYDPYKMILSFFAVVPVNEPKYAFYIGIGEPLVNKSNNVYATGGGVVGPIIGELIALSGPILNIPITEES